MGHTMPFDITIGYFLSELYLFSSHQFGNQVDWFASLFFSYHESIRRETNEEYTTGQSHVSRLLRDVSRFPVPIYKYYFNRQNINTCLYQDAKRYLAFVLQTNYQHVLFVQSFTALIINSENLNAKDKQYILDFGTYTSFPDDAYELLYRILKVLISTSVQHTPVHSKKFSSSQTIRL